MSKKKSFPRSLVKLFSALGQPTRLRILLVIGEGEACVCHLEAALGQRQAYISQHLMALRQAGLVVSRREGRNVFYRLKHPERLLDLIRQAAALSGVPEDELLGLSPATSPHISNCCCPHCEEDQALKRAPVLHFTAEFAEVAERRESD